MAAILEIRDGISAWWESPDIWVVPGSDPLGAVGTPIAGQPAYVWARVHNRGDVGVMSARVDFWWSNPTTGVTRSLSMLIGVAFVDIAAGTTEEVLCLSPWVPTFVNGGHECLVCEVISPADPLPQPAPDQFDPPTNHQIAQRNLSVLQTAPMVMALQIGTDPRADYREVTLRVETGGALDEATLGTLGLRDFHPAKEPMVKAGLSRSPSCGARTSTELGVPITRGQIGGAFLHIHPDEKCGEVDKETYTVVRIRQDLPRSAPGITYVVRSGRNG